MRIVYMGTPDFAVRPLKRLYEKGYEIAAVFTGVDKARGRSKRPVPCAVKKTALELGLTVCQPETMKDDAAYGMLRDIAPDAVIVAAYGQILEKRILELPKYGCINIHASLLPAYRGAAPIQWAVLNGEKTSGVTIMYMGEELDAGDILLQREVPLSDDETSDSLFEKLSECGGELIPEALRGLEEGTIVPVPQPKESTTPYARMIEKKDGRIDWKRSADALDRFVRGMNSWPGAATKLSGRTMKIWKAGVLQESTAYEPGTIVKADREGLHVQTGEGILSIAELQAEGKKRMAHDEFLRGAGWTPGMRFDND